MYNGIMNVYKEAGFTSHDVVAKLRGICKQKKIGHTGTLDPDAVGVLPVCFGSGTKLCDMLTDWDKEYIATLRLGLVTDTQDISGRVLLKTDPEKVQAVTEEQASESVMSFLGEYDQIPPMYSALKVNGKKLYELARAGREVERKPRRVQIRELEILEMSLSAIRFRVVCSKGTYIRTLCHDIGQKLGCGGVMKAL
ncbi:MAG: tRNA pseudouridine(55) synthase TruB, partial [Lachnospiraceae bacterium]|nr:tRNA pseudouridine(55) synthase TruB [Lachnospiraceae bacterium]